jgi:hypothetical protein
MAKVSITFEGDNWQDAMNAVYSLMAMPAPDLHVPRAVTVEPSDDTPAPEPKKATRAKPSATKASTPPPEPEPEPEPELEPEPKTTPTQLPAHMPTLEVLKQAVTVAVRAAQKNGGPKKILELLPEFKSETGLDFVMNAKEQHRPALYGLVQSAGLHV